MEREGDDLRGDFGREARESLRGKFRSELLPTGLLVGREAAGRGDLGQVGGVAAHLAQVAGVVVLIVG